ncbi:MAG: hypothetical protein J0L92_21745 [Deltaproteobacteria bacterium]|nr:hypothetical protein [Deltaproteobacteria bacterium]
MATFRSTFVVSLAVVLSVTSLGGGACLGTGEDIALNDDYGWVESSLTAAQRRTRAGQIRDAAAANGITQGWLLAGIADAETNMSHCHSELTWACRGPNSADCGGGPVVAGAGDGPCADRQGGLGMFQFDAGTFDDTLRREGDRILSIAGNVAAAVDFTTAMVVRSTHISGVDNREQAIEWMNGVRVGNGRWDAWVTTVTHYYNGCAPSYSCFSSRYARYRDITANVYSEMGADFWNVSERFGLEFVAQTFPFARDPFPIEAGETFTGYLELRNSGTDTWTPGATFLGTTGPRDVASAIAGPDWISPSRAATVDHVVRPGETGRFNFTVRAPAAAGDYPQFFNLVQEGVSWFSDDGGVPDDQIQVRVQSTAPPPCPEDIGATWGCDGSDRVRCERGMVFREECASGCVPDGVEGEGLCDGDNDGYVANDCDDARVEIHPGADEICGDGIDQDCDDEDAVCDPSDPSDPSDPVDPSDPTDPSDPSDPGTPTEGGITTRPMTLSGGCSAQPARHGATSLAWLVIGLGLALARRRRG